MLLDLAAPSLKVKNTPSPLFGYRFACKMLLRLSISIPFVEKEIWEPKYSGSSLPCYCYAVLLVDLLVIMLKRIPMQMI